MPQDDLRILRARAAALDGRLDVEDDRPSRDAGSPSFLCKVYDGGSMPSGGSQVYLVHPVNLDGDETEGASATPDVDADRSIPVVFLTQPIAGQVYSAVSIGGRWVASPGGGAGRKACKSTTAITARSGATPGGGSVQPLKNVSGTLTNVGGTISVGNLGAAIATGKYCMYWTDDYGAVWVEPEEC
ncbi:hypothetical protein [Paludisphaera rhizosphaerae]|uniref:hypothetical protein n=1 Tax=Paludisphaera rhizosphaerae TaxID=2711216 RepID=UPI0013ECCA9C|nr:hypothetical protein [Paludisphaera rhizosphaerae]